MKHPNVVLHYGRESLPDAIRAAREILGELPVPLVIPGAGYVLPDPAG